MPKSDNFDGDNKELIEAAKSLLELDAMGALEPHGIGNHARTLLEAFVVRLPYTDYSVDPQMWDDD